MNPQLVLTEQIFLVLWNRKNMLATSLPLLLSSGHRLRVFMHDVSPVILVSSDVALGYCNQSDDQNR